MTISDQVLYERLESGFYTRRKLRWDDYLALFGSVILPCACFVAFGWVWVLPLAAVFGFLWALNAGSTDYENSSEYRLEDFYWEDEI